MQNMETILGRARRIILKPKETWEKVKGEAVTVQELMINFAAPLALIPAVANLFGLSVVGIRMPPGHLARAPFAEALAAGVVGYVFHLLGVLAVAWVAGLLAPSFNAKGDYISALKVVVYSMTPVWLLGIFSAFPGLGVLQIFGLYGFYLLYQGLIVVLETPANRALWYTVLIVIASILISLLLTVFVGGAVYGPMFMRMMAV